MLFAMYYVLCIVENGPDTSLISLYLSYSRAETFVFNKNI